jgi:hypothetical protein
MESEPSSLSKIFRVTWSIDRAMDMPLGSALL